MAHEDTARELYEAIKPHVRVLTDGEIIAFNSHQIELLLVAALQAAEAEATERALGESLRDRAVVNEAPTGSSPSGLPSLSQATMRLDRALCNFVNEASDPWLPSKWEQAVKRNFEELARAYDFAHAAGLFSERDRNPQGGDFLGSVEDESPVSEGNSPNSAIRSKDHG